MRLTPLRAARAAALLTVSILLPVAIAGAQSFGAASGHVSAALGLAAKDEVPVAARLLAARVAVRPDDLTAQVHLSMLLDRMAAGADVAGLEGVRNVLPAWPPVLERLGAAYDDKGRHAEAEAVYRRWLKARPGNPEPAARLAEHYARTGRTDRAVAWFERHRALMGGESDYAERRIARVRADAAAAPAWAPPTGPGTDVAANEAGDDAPVRVR